MNWFKRILRSLRWAPPPIDTKFKVITTIVAPAGIQIGERIRRDMTELLGEEGILWDCRIMVFHSAPIVKIQIASMDDDWKMLAKLHGKDFYTPKPNDTILIQ